MLSSNISKKRDAINHSQIRSTTKPQNYVKNNNKLNSPKSNDPVAKDKSRYNNPVPRAPKPPIQLIEKPKNINNYDFKEKVTKIWSNSLFG